MYNINNAIYDIMSIYPSANKEEIKNLIIYTIQSEILPNVLLNIKLPRSHSRFDLKRIEFLEKRRGTKDIDFILNQMMHKDSIKDKFEFTKNLIFFREHFNNWTHLNFSEESNKNYLFYNQNLLDRTHTKNVHLNESSLDFDMDKRTIENPIHPYRDLAKKIDEYLYLDFDNEITKKILNENIFKDFIVNIEKSIRNNDEVNNIKNININEIYDFEFKEWNKIEVYLTFISDEFDEAIKSWDLIQTNVRNNLESGLSSLDEKDKTLYKDYIEKLFFHINFQEG